MMTHNVDTDRNVKPKSSLSGSGVGGVCHYCIEKGPVLKLGLDIRSKHEVKKTSLSFPGDTGRIGPVLYC